MKLKRLKVDFKDARGVIMDILDDVPMNAITWLTSRKGVVRGNHFHKKTVQYTYLVQGKVRYHWAKGAGKIHSCVLKPGDLAISPAGETHTVEALADSAFLAISYGPRHGKNYEADTYRPLRLLARGK